MTATFTKDPRPSSFRKLAAAMWVRPNDPTIYGTMDVEATRLLETLEKLRATTGTKLTVTHFVARAVALMFAKYPECNAKVRWWGKVELRNSIDLFLQVATDEGLDLSGALVENADRKDAVALAGEISEKARRIRANDDPTYARSRNLFLRIPWFFMRLVVKFSSFLVNELHLHLPRLGMPRDPFGTAMITSVGMFGVDTAFAPLTPIARCSTIVLVGEVRDRPWVVEKRVEVRPVLRLCATFDHRVIDGAHAGKLGRELTRLLGNPELLVGASPETPTLRIAAGAGQAEPASPPAKA